MNNETITLESIRFFAEQTFSRECIVGYKHNIDIIKNEFDHLIFILEARVWGKQLETKTIKHPLNWWEALKERFAPAWLLKKHPVVYKTYDIDAKILYPNLKIQVPNEQHVVYMQVYDSISKY